MEKKKNRQKFCHRRCWQMESIVCGLRQKQRGLPDQDSLCLYTRQMQANYFHARSVSVKLIKKQKKIKTGISCDRRKDRNKTVFRIKGRRFCTSDRTFGKWISHMKKQKERKSS